MESLFAVAARFSPEEGIIGVQPYGRGNINDTFLVTRQPAAGPAFILQRLNSHVFRRPELVLHNIRTVTAHVRARLQRSPLESGRRWELPDVLPTQDGRDFWLDTEGLCWRAMSFIDRADSFDTVETVDRAREMGYALGLFHRLISDLPIDTLADTLEGFHVTPSYLADYDRALATRGMPGSAEAAYCAGLVRKQRGMARVLEDARAAGSLPLRAIHGDPKVNNVLLDRTTGQAVSLVDLDTVKPGLIHYDVGDWLRSSCNPLGEETEQWEQVGFEPELCRAILEGYLPHARRFFTEPEAGFLYDAIRLIPFELGLRFFTDYLEGNVYFKVKHPDHNLARALVQFRLAERIESQEPTIRRMLAEMQ